MSASRELVYVTVVCLYVLVFAATAKGQRAIPDDNLAYPRPHPAIGWRCIGVLPKH
jgi:hypothetical protein